MFPFLPHSNSLRQMYRTPPETPVSDLQEHDNFKMFDQDPETIAAIASDMKTCGYDPARPMVGAEGAWTKEKIILVEGYQRKAALGKAGIKEVEIILRHFKTEQFLMLTFRQPND